MRYIVAIILLAPSLSFAQAGLIGADRQSFIENAFKVCLDKQTRGSNEAKFASLAQYCVCYSNRLADRLSTDENKTLDELYSKDKAQLEVRLSRVLDGIAEECSPAIRQ